MNNWISTPSRFNTLFEWPPSNSTLWENWIFQKSGTCQFSFETKLFTALQYHIYKAIWSALFSPWFYSMQHPTFYTACLIWMTSAIYFTGYIIVIRKIMHYKSFIIIYSYLTSWRKWRWSYLPFKRKAVLQTKRSQAQILACNSQNLGYNNPFIIESDVEKGQKCHYRTIVILIWNFKTSIVWV